jgi:hypothetical protein
MTITMTASEMKRAKEDHALLTRRLERLNRFIDEKYATSDLTRLIIVEARDLVAQEKLTLELRLSIAIEQARKAGAVL